MAKDKNVVVKSAKIGTPKKLSGAYQSGKPAKAAAASALTQRPVTKRANVSSAQAQSAVRSYLAKRA